MENSELSAPKTEPDLPTNDQSTAPQAPITAAQVGALFAAGEPAFRTGSSTSSRAWQPPAIADLQQALPQYEILEFVARGGMGAVYKGIQRSLSRTVAIKVLPPEVAAHDPGFADRFMNEARAMARLAHPNIVAVHETGKTPEGLLYFVMEFVEGRDVSAIIGAEQRLEPALALDIAAAVCDALAFAHEEGIIHRDIKPSNIMLDKRGRVKVADFGLAKVIQSDATLLTHSDMAIGTPDFAAPELTIPGMKVDQRADIYALGVTLYQMLTGHLPRGRFRPPSQLAPHISPRLDRIVDKALQSVPNERYSAAAEMKRDLERVMKSRPATAPGAKPAGKGNFWIKAAALIVLSAAVAGIWWYQTDRPSTPAPSAAAVPAPAPAPPTPPAPRPALSKRSPRNSPQGKAEAIWESRWHQAGRLRAAGTAMDGKPFDLTAAEPFSDFVQVFVIEFAYGSSITWAALRANGKVVWSDGTMDVDRVGLVRSWSDLQPILSGGAVQPTGVPPPAEPVTDFSFGRMSFLSGRPTVIAYADLSGRWQIQSTVFESGLMEKPDLTTPPKVAKVIVDIAGIGVLRKDGSFRIWNQKEVALPESVARDITAVVPMGSSWTVLKKDGHVFNFAMMRETAAGLEQLSEPGNVRRFLDAEGAAVDLAHGGYAPVVKHADGHWSTSPSLKVINAALTELHKTRNESFSVFSSQEKEGILWIEPVR